MRKKIVAGNWKMNKSFGEGLELAKAIRQYFDSKAVEEPQVIICTPFIHLSSVSDILAGSEIMCGAQNCHSEDSGAYTGEVSASMIASTGATYVIIGHSERRTYNKETDELLEIKTRKALENGLKVIFCCGEVLDEREKGAHFDVVRKQLDKGLFQLDENNFRNIILAYEPVWAIGTGVTATPEQAQEMHAYIRELVAGRYNKETAENTTILYGGSCNPGNARELFSNSDVDGGLIGGASLKPDQFCAIAESF